jgi:hypothetical protein
VSNWFQILLFKLNVYRYIEAAFRALAKVVRASETTQEVMPRRHDLRWAMTVIAAETPKSSTFGQALNIVNGANGGNGSNGSNGGGVGDEDDDLLVGLALFTTLFRR